jgi:hypothetical protein|tara:strand:- start:80 stop:286 length:207 start_codon:yes stop_codon:yes gene_type:complete
MAKTMDKKRRTQKELDAKMRAIIDSWGLSSHLMTMKDVERFPKGTKFLKRSKDGVWKTIISKGKNHET